MFTIDRWNKINLHLRFIFSERMKYLNIYLSNAKKTPIPLMTYLHMLWLKTNMSTVAIFPQKYHLFTTTKATRFENFVYLSQVELCVCISFDWIFPKDVCLPIEASCWNIKLSRFVILVIILWWYLVNLQFFFNKWKFLWFLFVGTLRA